MSLVLKEGSLYIERNTFFQKNQLFFVIEKRYYFKLLSNLVNENFRKKKLFVQLTSELMEKFGRGVKDFSEVLKNAKFLMKQTRESPIQAQFPAQAFYFVMSRVLVSSWSRIGEPTCVG